MKRRELLAGVAALSVPLAGCSASGLGDLVGGSDTPTPSDLSDHVESGSGSYPHPIDVHNRTDEAVTVSVEISRYGTTHFEHTYTVPANTERTVAGFTVENLPPAHHRVRIAASTASGRSSETTYHIDHPCYVGVHISVSEERFDVSYSVC